MKKNTKILLGITAVFLIAGLIFTGIGLAKGADPVKFFSEDCEIANINLSDDDYRNEFNSNSTYNISTEGIHKIEVSWVSGDVNFIPYEGDSIVIEESSSKKIDEKNALGYKVEDGELEISFSKTVTISGMNKKGITKKLIVRVPETMAANLKEITCDTVSGDVNIEKIVLEELEVDTVSGNINVISDNLPYETEIDTTSGNAYFQIPEDLQFKASLESVSGQFFTTLEGIKNGEDFIVGTGTNEIEMNSVSGNLYINYKE